MKKKTAWITAGTLAAVLVGTGVGVAVADPFDDDRLAGPSLERAGAAALAEVSGGRVTDSERSDDPDHAYEIEVTTDDGQEVDVELDGSFEVVRVDDDGRGRLETVAPVGNSTATPAPTPGTGSVAGPDAAPIGDEERTRAGEAAVAAAGGGTVTELERSDDLDHAWEVEVTLDDGVDVDIELDAAFAVTRIDR